MRIRVPEPFDWSAMLAYFRTRAIRGVESVDGESYARVVAAGETGGAESLRITRTPAGITAAGTSDRHRVRRLFGLDRDHGVAVEHLLVDPIIGPRLRAAPGLRVPGTWDLYETGVRAIVGQQVSVAGASTVTARLVARHGRPLGSPLGELTHAFPTSDVLASADLDAIGLTGGRITAIRSWATAVADGRVVLDGTVPLDELVTSVVALRGLGPWTAHYIALRAGYADAFPVADLGLQRATGLGERALAAVAESWRPHRALAAVHLWETLGPT